MGASSNEHIRPPEVCVEGDLRSSDDVDAKVRQVVAALMDAGHRELSWDVRFLGDITPQGAASLAGFMSELADQGVTSTIVWHPNFEARHALAGLNAKFIDAVLQQSRPRQIIPEPVPRDL